MMARIVKRFLWIIIAVSMVVLALLLWLTTSNSGLRLIVQQATKFAPELSIAKIDGRLIGPLSLSDVTWRNNQVSVNVRQIKLDWALSQLFRQTLVIHQLSIDGAKVTQYPQPSSPPTATTKKNAQPLEWKLPLAVILSELVITDSHYTAAPEAKSIELQKLLLSVVADNEKLQIKQLDINSSLLNANGNVIVFSSPDKNSDGTIDWQLTVPDIKPVRATTELSGNIKSLTLTNNLQTPYNTAAAITFNNPLALAQKNSTLSADLTVKKLQLNEINKQWPTQTVSLNQHLQGDLTQLSLNGWIETLNTRFLTDARWQQQRSSHQWSLKTQWSKWQWPEQQPRLTSTDGQLSINGDNTSYTLSLFSQLNAQNLDGELRLNGSGSNNSLEISTLSLTGPLGNLKGQADVQWQSQLSANAQLTGTNINPGVFAADWPGALNFDLTLTSRQSRQQTRIEGKLNAEGTLKEQPLSLSTSGAFQPQQLTIEQLAAQWGDNQLTGDTQWVNERWNIHWQLAGNNLSQMWPGARGEINSQGHFQGTINEPQITATVLANNIQLDRYRADALTGDIAIDWRAGNTQTQESSLSITGNNVRINQQSLDRVDINGQGKPEQHQIAMTLQSPQGDLQTQLQGQWLAAQQQWQYRINNATLAAEGLSPWSLDGDASGSVTTSQQHIDQHCWRNQSAQLCLQAENNSQQSKADITVGELPINEFAFLFPEGLQWQDTQINGGGTLRYQQSTLLTDLQFTSSPGVLQWQEDAQDGDQPTAPQTLSVEAGSFQFNADEKQLTATLTLPLAQQPGIAASVSLQQNHDDWLQRSLSGEVTLALETIAPFATSIPDTSNAAGQLRGQWQIGGSLQQPWIEGQVALTNGQLALNSPGLLLNNITMTLEGNRQQGLRYRASANSGGGSLSVTGSASLDPSQPQLSLKLTGDKAQIMATTEATVYASPDITVTIDKQQTAINGNVIIPKARITPKELPPSVVRVSEDQVIVSEASKESPNRTMSLTADVQLQLLDDVFIEGFGFKGNATGNLRITKAKTGPTLGNGDIRILNGEYRAFGQGLVIDKGTIIFSGGPVNKPGIDIKALRRPAENVTVGVFARGTLQKPELTIFSEPPMGQQEQLSWLVLGRPPEQTTEGESNALNQLLLSLSLTKGDDILSNLGDTFKLDTLRIKTGSGEAGAASDNELAELVLGKYLTPDLYVSYGIGLFKPVNVLSLEYSLGRRWKLTSESSVEASGGDLVYTVEK